MNDSKLIQALIAVQTALGSSVTKDAVNPHFKSKYATLDAVLGAIHPHLAANGLAMVQNISGAAEGITVSTTLYHKDGASLSTPGVYIPVDKKSPQAAMSASTYGRRYDLMALFSLAPADDDGNAAEASIDQMELQRLTNLILKAKTMDELKRLYMDGVHYARMFKNHNAEKALEAAKDAAKERLNDGNSD